MIAMNLQTRDTVRFKDPIMQMLMLLTLIISLANANSCT